MPILTSLSASGVSHQKNSKYKVGDTGPGGGKIYYDSGIYNGTFQYLEVAPSTWNGAQDPALIFSGNTTTEVSTGLSYGTGYANTLALVANNSTAGTAITTCRAYTGGGKTDWFLPNLNELLSLYDARNVTGVGPFITGAYHSSSTGGPSNPTLDFGYNPSTAAGGSLQLNKATAYGVRPIRYVS